MLTKSEDENLSLPGDPAPPGYLPIGARISAWHKEKQFDAEVVALRRLADVVEEFTRVDCHRAIKQIQDALSALIVVRTIQEKQ